MQLVPIFNLNDAQNVVDSEPLESFDWEWSWERRDEHVDFDERVPNVLRDRLLPLPVHGMLVEVLIEKGATGFLPAPVRVLLQVRIRKNLGTVRRGRSPTL